MYEEILTRFSNGDYKAIGESLQKCDNPKLASILNSYFARYYPNDLRRSVFEIQFHIANSEFEKAYELTKTILNCNLPPDVINIVRKFQLSCIPKIKDRYIKYNEAKVEQIKERRKVPFPQVTFTITTCKRLELFEKTMNSFLNCCTDVDVIDEWFCVDDNSSLEDRKRMQELYPFFTFYFKTPQEKGHAQSMNIIREHVKTPYMFHMEDDWQFFTKSNYITDCLHVLSMDNKYGQCLLNKNYSEIPEIDVIGGSLRQTHYLRFYEHEHCANDEEYNKFYEKYGRLPNSAYWKHFSLRPSLLRFSILKQLGEFNPSAAHFEADYSERYYKQGYISVFLEQFACIHIGRLTSEIGTGKENAYTLNKEKQFGYDHSQPTQAQPTQAQPTQDQPTQDQPTQQTEISIKLQTHVINLDRRPDRWSSFTQLQEPKFLKYNRYSAIDGNELQLTEQLQRIFDGNDYNMKAGMVGCALSHIDLYIKLIESQHDAFLILEDDITFSSNFENKFKTLLNELSTKDWDICFVGYHLWPTKKSVYVTNDVPVIVKFNTRESIETSMGGTTGYLISKKGAKNFLEYLNKVGMTNCIDTMQQRCCDFMNVYYSKPRLIDSECWNINPNANTDIQTNHKSLAIPIDKRFEEEKKFYKDYTEFSSEIEFKMYISNPDATKVCFYRNNVADFENLMKQCCHPFYILQNEIAVVVPKPTAEIQNKKFFDRLKVKGKFDISSVLLYGKKQFILNMSEIYHISKYSVKNNGSNVLFDYLRNLSPRKVEKLIRKLFTSTIGEFVQDFLKQDKITHDIREMNIIIYNKEYDVIYEVNNGDNISETLGRSVYELFLAIRSNALLHLIFGNVISNESGDDDYIERIVKLISPINPNIKIHKINMGIGSDIIPYMPPQNANEHELNRYNSEIFSERIIEKVKSYIHGK